MKNLQRCWRDTGNILSLENSLCRTISFRQYNTSALLNNNVNPINQNKGKNLGCRFYRESINEESNYQIFGRKHYSSESKTLTWDTVLSEENRQRCIKKMSKQKAVRDVDSKSKRPGAVLVPLCLINGELSLLYTVRSKNLKSHRGQISFPGGMQDDSDRDLIHTALRETEEEVGILQNHVDVWGFLPPVPSLQDSAITAVLGFCDTIDVKDLILSTNEVEYVFTVTLKKLTEPSVTAHTQFRSKRFKKGYTMPLYCLPDHKIWGLTAIFTHMTLLSLLPGLYNKKLKHISPLL